MRYSSGHFNCLTTVSEGDGRGGGGGGGRLCIRLNSSLGANERQAKRSGVVVEISRLP